MSIFRALWDFALTRPHSDTFLTRPCITKKVARGVSKQFFTILSYVVRWCCHGYSKVSCRGFERPVRHKANDNVGKMKVYHPRHFCF